MDQIVPYSRPYAYGQVTKALVAHYGKKLAKQLLSQTTAKKPQKAKIKDQMRPISNNSVDTAAPIAVGSTRRTAAPRIRTGSRSTIVAQTELIEGTVSGATSYTVVNSFSLNPGLSNTMPWGSSVAQKYEMYRFLECWVEYVPIAPTTTQGDIALIPEYDPTASPPASEAEAYAHSGAIIGSVWQKNVLKFDPKKLHALGPYRFVRDGNVPGDLKTYDAGRFWVAANNETSSSPIGKLFLHYRIELLNPVLETAAISRQPTSAMFRYTSANQVVTTSVPTSVNFGSLQYDTLDMDYASGVFTPPKGVYQYSVVLGVNDTANETFTALAFANYNSVNLPGQVSIVQASGVNQKDQLALNGIFAADGSSDFIVYATLTGAAGTLTINSSSILIKAI